MRKYFLALIIAFTCFVFSNALADDKVISPKEHIRSEEQTYLTFPEWYLVFSPDELASFIKDHNPSDFPFMGHIGQFWNGYYNMYQATKEKYPTNWGYHVMVMVIGVSTTVEYSIKWLYGNTIGRFSHWTSTHGMTKEDKFAADVARDYVDFINVTPWYEYPFTTKLKHLWTDTDLTGPDMIRKWERKFALSIEYGVKAVYGSLIKLGTKTAYDAPIPVTAMVIDALPDGMQEELPELNVLKQEDNYVLITVPRYAAFTEYASQLAKNNINFIEIAGNKKDILLSVITPESAKKQPTDTHKVLFEQDIITQDNKKRIIVLTKVNNLAMLLNNFMNKGYKIEHIYDY